MPETLRQISWLRDVGARTKHPETVDDLKQREKNAPFERAIKEPITSKVSLRMAEGM